MSLSSANSLPGRAGAQSEKTQTTINKTAQDTDRRLSV